MNLPIAEETPCQSLGNASGPMYPGSLFFDNFVGSITRRNSSNSFIAFSAPQRGVTRSAEPIASARLAPRRDPRNIVFRGQPCR